MSASSFFFYADNQPAADDLIASLRAGLMSGNINAGTSPYTLTCNSTPGAPDTAPVYMIVLEFERLTKDQIHYLIGYFRQHYTATYDGWDCEVKSAPNSNQSQVPDQ
jgi:hypothetical protein